MALPMMNFDFVTILPHQKNMDVPVGHAIPSTHSLSTDLGQLTMIFCYARGRSSQSPSPSQWPISTAGIKRHRYQSGSSNTLVLGTLMSVTRLMSYDSFSGQTYGHSNNADSFGTGNE